MATAGLQNSAAWFTANNPILGLGQIGQESDTYATKIGDGITAWNSLAYREQPEMFSTVSGTNTYTADATFPTIKAYYVGLTFRLKFTNANTGASILNVNGIGAQPIKKVISNLIQHMGTTGLKDLQSGDITATGIYNLKWDGTYFQLLP